MTPAAIFDRLQDALGPQAVFDLHADPKRDKDPWFAVAPEAWVRVATFLRDDDATAFDFMECLTGTDWPEKKEIQVTFHLYSYARKHRAVVKLRLDRDAPHMPTVSAVWPAANWQERECFDLLGVLFDGHPDLRRLLLPGIGSAIPCVRISKKRTRTMAFPPAGPIPSIF